MDTSVLICLHHLNLLQYLNLIFNKVFVPRAVEKEFLTKHRDKNINSIRFSFLENFYAKHFVWFIKCQAYNSDIIQIYKTEKKLDDGEIEVFAQNQEMFNKNTLLLDEKEGRKIAEKNNLAKNGVLYILAILDVKYKLINYFDSVEILREECGSRLGVHITQKVYDLEKMRK